MAKDDSQVDAGRDTLLLRMDGKLDALASEVGDIKGRVITRDTFCVSEHRRVDEKLGEDRARIITMEKAQQSDQSVKDQAKGVWKSIAVIGGSLVAGGGLVLGAVRLWGG